MTVSPSVFPTVRGGSRGLWGRISLGVALGLVVVGPGLGPGPLLNLDLLVTPNIPIPNGIFGLGPALTQRVPFFALLGIGSRLVGGPAAVKITVVALIAAGFVGAARLADGALSRAEDDGGEPGGLAAMGAAPSGANALAPVAAGVLWAAGPFALTRLGAGHLNLIWVVGVLPWALPHLWQPAVDPRRTFRASVLVAIGGPAAGTLGLTAVAVSLLADWPGPARAARSAGNALVANLVWVAPTVVVLWAGAEVSSAGDFATALNGPADALAVVAGAGFWREDQQVGATGWVGLVLAAVLVGLAVSGRRAVALRWGEASVWVAVVGLGLALVSAVPGLREPYRQLSLLPLAAPLRESHRFLALWLAAATPAAAVGGARLAGCVASRSHRSRLGTDTRTVSGRGDGPRVLSPSYRQGLVAVAGAVPLVVAVAMSVPGWWGLGGRLTPVTFPPGWSKARQLIEANPGTAVALPWNEYPALSFAGGRTVFNPAPDFLGGDVISSYDPLFDPARPGQEQVDRRAIVVDRLVRRAVRGVPIAADLGDLGVRWVFLAKEGGWRDLDAVDSDTGLRIAFEDASVALYEVRSWPGDAVNADGVVSTLSRPWPPYIQTDATSGSVLSVAGAPGWVRGWRDALEVTADGRLRLTSDAGPVWFWPAPLLIALDLGVAVAALCPCRLHRRRR